LKIKQLQGRIVETYLLTVDDVTEDERHELMEWIADGNFVYDNPHLIYNESGCPMDFINGCRVVLDMCQNPSDYFGDVPTEGERDNRIDEDIPF
jgi:hypothetical protein